MITPHACARGKATGFVRLSAQKSPDLEILVGIIERSKYNYNARKVGKLIFFAFLALETGHEHINPRFLSATSFDHTQLCHVLPQLRVLELCRKGLSIS